MVSKKNQHPCGETEPTQDPSMRPGHPAKLDYKTHEGRWHYNRRETGESWGPRGAPSSRRTPAGLRKQRRQIRAPPPPSAPPWTREPSAFRGGTPCEAGPRKGVAAAAPSACGGGWRTDPGSPANPAENRAPQGAGDGAGRAGFRGLREWTPKDQVWEALEWATLFLL